MAYWLRVARPDREFGNSTTAGEAPERVGFMTIGAEERDASVFAGEIFVRGFLIIQEKYRSAVVSA
jgi:hypothetical protein